MAKDKVVSVLFLDIKGAFPSVNLKRLIHDMRKRGVPREYTDWITHKIGGRRTTMVFDGYESPLFTLPCGTDQGCPLSGMLFQFYNADLLDVANTSNGEDAVAFVDDTALLATASTFKAANQKLKVMMEQTNGGFAWAASHGCEFAVEKFALVGFTRKTQPAPTPLQGSAPQTGKPRKTQPIIRPDIQLRNLTIKATDCHKFLGMLLDQELHFKAHAAYAIKKGTTWLDQFRRAARPSKGISARHMRRFYLAVAIPRMLYAADVFLIPPRKGKRGSKGIVTQLARVQRRAAIHTTGALRTTPTDLLDAHADLIPFTLLVDKICHAAALRLATLPRSHPLHHHVQEAAEASFTKSSKSPIHHLMFAYDIHPTHLETIRSVRQGPKWEPSFGIQIAQDKKAALLSEKSNRDHIQVYSDGSAIDGGVGAAAILFRNGIRMATLRKYLGRANAHTVYEAEVVGIGLGIELIRREEVSLQASIAVDSKAAIQATQSTAAGSGAYLMDRVHSAAARLRREKPQLTLTVRWVPGHTGVPGNELVDVEAKKAAREEESDRQTLPGWAQQQLPISKSATLQIFHSDLKKRTHDLFERSPRRAKIQYIDASTPSHNFRRITAHIPRKHASILIQLRTGHVPLQRYLYMIGKTESALCPACGGHEETVRHFLLVCPTYDENRHRLGRTIDVSGVRMDVLLNDPKAFPALFRFIHDSKRFQDAYGDFGKG